MKPKISLVIPTTKENDESYLVRLAALYPKDPEIEYIVVDRATPKNLWDKLNRSDFNIIETEKLTRAEKLSIGLEVASGDLIVFHHPRSILEIEALLFLLSQVATLSWGGFTHEFDTQSNELKFTSWYSNCIRPRLSKIVYLDHCIFFKKHLLDREIPSIPIFEDTEISKILKKSGPPLILPFKSKTSSVRFQKNGFWKQATKNQILKLAYHLGAPKTVMNKIYENNLNLN